MPGSPWDADERNFPEKGGVEERLRFLLNYAVLAPSSHNTQPWLFDVKGPTVEIYADRTRALPVVDPEDRALTISCGAALFNLRAALSRFDYGYSVEVLPVRSNPDLLARVTIAGKDGESEDEARLFESIKMRRTNRMPFQKTGVPPDVKDRIEQAASIEGAWLYTCDSLEERLKVADLVAEGDRIQAGSRLFRRELASWVHSNRTRSRDGMPGYAFGISDSVSYASPLVIRTFDWGKGQAARDRQLAEGSPLLTVLCTGDDTPASWINAGTALERTLLTACLNGIYASFLNQPIEVSTLRPRLKEITGKGHPQIILRMGYGPEVRPTPRRALSEVILQEA
ncbi:MAG: nitroreductase [Deltaproteobacteria bacterium]|nr:nitroreductase [Deltaproteobacteria bacterium]